MEIGNHSENGLNGNTCMPSTKRIRSLHFYNSFLTGFFRGTCDPKSPIVPRTCQSGALHITETLKRDTSKLTSIFPSLSQKDVGRVAQRNLNIADFSGNQLIRRNQAWKPFYPLRYAGRWRVESERIEQTWMQGMGRRLIPQAELIKMGVKNADGIQGPQ